MWPLQRINGGARLRVNVDHEHDDDHHHRDEDEDVEEEESEGLQAEVYARRRGTLRSGWELLVSPAGLAS